MDKAPNLLVTVVSGLVGAAIGAAAVLYLNKRFIRMNDVEGHAESKWTPRNYGASTGDIPDAQARLHADARTMLDQCLPLLHGLHALSPDATPQDLHCVRHVVHFQLSELVDELGHEGGPRVARVDHLFTELLGNPPSANLTHAGGELANLRTHFGLPRDYANTAEDEQNLTSFVILTDYVIALQRSWDEVKRFFRDEK